METNLGDCSEITWQIKKTADHSLELNNYSSTVQGLINTLIARQVKFQDEEEKTLAKYSEAKKRYNSVLHKAESLKLLKTSLMQKFLSAKALISAYEDLDFHKISIRSLNNSIFSDEVKRLNKKKQGIEKEIQKTLALRTSLGGLYRKYSTEISSIEKNQKNILIKTSHILTNKKLLQLKFKEAKENSEKLQVIKSELLTKNQKISMQKLIHQDLLDHFIALKEKAEENALRKQKLLEIRNSLGLVSYRISQKASSISEKSILLNSYKSALSSLKIPN